MKVYKVVRVIDGKRVSAIVNYNKDLLVEYIPNKWVCPIIGGTKLFAFNNLDSAKDWTMNIGCLGRHFDEDFVINEIWECEATDVENIGSTVLVCSYDIEDINRVIDVWKHQNGATCSMAGAIACSNIKLLRKVWPVSQIFEESLGDLQ